MLHFNQEYYYERIQVFERFLEKLIQELGATGILVIGLYFLLFKPLTLMQRHTKNITEEISKIYDIIIKDIEEKKGKHYPR